MKKLKFNIFNKKLFILISFFISLFALLTIFLGIYSQKSDKYTIYTNNLTNKMYITEIRIGDSIVKLNNYEYKDLKYNSKLNKIVVSNKNNYIIKKSKIDNLKLALENKTENIENLYIKKNTEKAKKISIKGKKTFVYMDNNNTSSIIKSVFCCMSKIHFILLLLLFLILWVISYFFILFISIFINNLINNKFSVFKFIISMLMLYFINLLYILPLLQFSKYFAILPMLIILLILIIYVSKNKKSNLQYYYLIISMFVGVLFLFVFPPLHVPDETLHMIKSYQDSFSFQEKHEFIDKTTYVYLPKNMDAFISKYGDQTLNYDYRLQARTYTYDLFKLNDYNNLSNYYKWHGLKYTSSIPYLPGSVISLIARFTKMPLLLFYQLAKLFNYIISVLMCYYALKIVPKFKKIFFIVPLLPIFIQQSFGFNVDWLTNSTFILLLAFIIKGIYNINEMHRKDYIIMIFLSILLGFCKFGYFPIALLFLLIPLKNSNMSLKKRRIYIAAIIILTISLPILVNITFKLYSSKMHSSETVNYRNLIPMSSLYTNPKMILSMVKETFKIRLDLDFFRGLVTGFGWSTIWANSLSLFISLVLLVSIVLCSDKDNVKLNLKQKIAFLITFVMICGIIYGAMLFGWSEIGSTSIDGLQPRYFIPPVMLLYILLQNEYIIINIKNKKMFYAVVMIIINILGLLTILEKVYL